MILEILTIGYGGKKPDAFFAEIEKLEPCYVVDVRRDPFHAFLGVYTKSYLEKHVTHYFWLQELGNKVKRLPPKLIDEKHGMGRLKTLSKLAECAGISRIVLLCAEKDEKRCHRLYVKMAFLYGDLRNKISQCWSKDTNYFTKKEKIKSRGQCYVTALLVQDLLSGDVLMGSIDQKKWSLLSPETHYWNRLPDGTELDFTSDQYGGDGFNPIIEGMKARRVNHKNKRYLLLKRAYMWRFGWSQ